MKEAKAELAALVGELLVRSRELGPDARPLANALADVHGDVVAISIAGVEEALQCWVDGDELEPIAAELTLDAVLAASDADSQRVAEVTARKAKRRAAMRRVVLSIIERVGVAGVAVALRMITAAVRG